MTSPALAVHPCRALCRWVATRAQRPSGAVLACAGCGSQWAPDQGWLPVDADGSVPTAARAALPRRG